LRRKEAKNRLILVVVVVVVVVAVFEHYVMFVIQSSGIDN
jgi:hypothetical protein